jgi:siroheme decarboxylase
MGYHNATPKISVEDAKQAPISLTTADLQLINAYQRNFPLVARPYLEMAKGLNIDEETVIQRLQYLTEAGVVSRVGAVIQTGKAGCSTLAAIEVPEGQLQQVADLVTHYPEVNHNYEREHKLNLWFVVTAANQERMFALLEEIEQECGYKVHILPMIKNYHIDLGFPIC